MSRDASAVVLDNGSSIELRVCPKIDGKFFDEFTVQLLNENETRYQKITYRGFKMPEVEIRPAAINVTVPFVGVLERTLEASSLAEKFDVSGVNTNFGEQGNIESTLNGNKKIKLVIPERVAEVEDPKIFVEINGKSTVVVPINIINLRVRTPSDFIGQQGRPSAGADEKTKTLSVKIQSLTEKWQKSNLPNNSPNWVRFHRLLLFTHSQQSILESRKLLERESNAFIESRGKISPQTFAKKFDNEHHPSQVLHILSILGVDTTARISVDSSREFRVEDLLQSSKFHTHLDQELAWTISALSGYLGFTEKWRNKFDEELSIHELASHLLQSNERVCGGTHQLYALARIRSIQNSEEHAELTELWNEIDKRLQDERSTLEKGVLPDGSLRLPTEMASGMFESPESFSLVKGIYYSGHSLEWLNLHLKKDELESPFVMGIVGYLVRSIERQYPRTMQHFDFENEQTCRDFGNLMHAMHALESWRDSVELTLD